MTKSLLAFAAIIGWTVMLFAIFSPMATAQNIEVSERPIELVQVWCGHEKALACAHIDEATGDCWIIIAREQDHGFDMIAILQHELAHCDGMEHAPGEAFEFPRRQ